MGFLTLEDFRDEVKHALGGAGLGNKRIDRWINQGIQTVAGQLRFKELLNRGSLTTMADEPQYPLPSGALGVNSMWIEAEGKRLLQTTLENLRRPEESELPVEYAVDGSFVYLGPPPDTVYVIDFIYAAYHPRVTSALETTILPPGWDQACLCFAKYYALQSMNRESQARNWFMKGQHEIGVQRASLEYDFDGGPNRGFGVARELGHLTDIPDAIS